VKKVIGKNEPWSKIHADNPTITEEDFAKFKENCGKEEVKARSEKMKALQARNTPPTASEAVVTRGRGTYGPRRTPNVKVTESQTPCGVHRPTGA
jgi:hypothetical protein